MPETMLTAIQNSISFINGLFNDASATNDGMVVKNKLQKDINKAS
jgi:hypothetical protein